jgi:hypothetical protein
MSVPPVYVHQFEPYRPGPVDERFVGRGPRRARDQNTSRGTVVHMVNVRRAVGHPYSDARPLTGPRAARSALSAACGCAAAYRVGVERALPAAGTAGIGTHVARTVSEHVVCVPGDASAEPGVRAARTPPSPRSAVSRRRDLIGPPPRSVPRARPKRRKATRTRGNHARRVVAARAGTRQDEHGEGISALRATAVEATPRDDLAARLRRRAPFVSAWVPTDRRRPVDESGPRGAGASPGMRDAHAAPHAAPQTSRVALPARDAGR